METTTLDRGIPMDISLDPTGNQTKAFEGILLITKSAKLVSYVEKTTHIFPFSRRHCN